MASNSAAQAIHSPPEFTFNLADTRLKITYKNAPTYAHVYSGAMAQASPVWKNFLFPPWSGPQGTNTNIRQEGKENILSELTKLQLEPVRELDFTEDNAEALIILLSIAHLTSEEILHARPPVPILVNLAILCDAYLCHNLVRPWIGKWISGEWSYEDDYWFEAHHCWRRKLDDCKAMMLVGWVFRPISKHNVFLKGVEWLYDNNKINNLPEFPENWPIPKNLMKTILDARNNTIIEVVAILYKYLIDLEGKQNDICPQHQRKCKEDHLETYKFRLDRWGCRLYPRKQEFHSIRVSALLNVDLSIGSCDRAMQDRLKGEIEQISKRHKEAMWNEINYFERPDERPEHEKHRITNITGGWRKDNRFEYETTGYDSDRPSFTGDSDPDTD